MKKDGFKKLDDFTDSFVTKKIGTESAKTKIFSENTNAYSKSKDSYIQVKSYDEESKMYTCKEVKNDGSPVEEWKLPKDDVTKFITVRVKLISSNKFQENNEEVGQNLKMKVNIDDKISKLQRYSCVGTKSSIDGFISVNGELIENVDETSFYRKFIKNGQIISISYQEGAAPDPKKWRRFKDNIKTDYTYLDYTEGYFDAVTFIPKRDVWFFGFGIYPNYHKKDMDLKIKWAIGPSGADYMSEVHDLKVVQDEVDQEMNWFTVDIRDYGEKPIKVSEGTHIHVLEQQTKDDYELRRVNYGCNGDKRYYSELPDQEYEFDIEYSTLNRNNTN